MNGCSDPYAILMVRPGATAREIRIAFKNLIGQWHPDVTASPEAHDRSAVIIKAYRSLSQPTRRSGVDRRQNESASASSASPLHERRRGERRLNHPIQLPRAWRMATLAWVAVASSMIASTVASELPNEGADQVRFNTWQPSVTSTLRL
jgi:curved DNA-binding protein CbpA